MDQNMTNQQKGWETRMSKIQYPQWIFDQLAHEEDKIRLKNKQVKTKEKLEWICPIHGVYAQRFSSHVKSDLTPGQGCRKCSCSTNVGKRLKSSTSNTVRTPGNPFSNDFKLDIALYLKTLNVPIITNKTFTDGTLTLTTDFYNEDKKVAIVCASSKDWAEVGPNQTLDRSKKTKAMNYWYMMRSQGIRLIWLQDFVYYSRPEKLKAVIRNALSPNEVIYARNTVAVQIDHKMAQEMCNRYHVDGCAYTQIYSVGLFKKGDEITVDNCLQCMTFSHRRFAPASNNCDYECARMCVKTGITVVGGSSKMFWKFVDDCKPIHILTYSANSWFAGSGYDKIGFDTVGDSGPSYQWVSFRGVAPDGTEDEFYAPETNVTTEIKRESVQVKKLKVHYPELYKVCYEDSLTENPKFLGGIENAMCSALGYWKVHNAGNCRHEMCIVYDRDPRTYSICSPKDVVTVPFYGGDYYGHVPKKKCKLTDIPEFLKDNQPLHEDFTSMLEEESNE